ncbi:unnamed protein product [Rotaria socialis]|uniref:Integral membrane protein GPR155 n=1 Tax=Rotaria socialis TaxID=392032 RepID=A0A819Y3S9_9BILA|nr:unnamed protein product [Rotaria socialis]CAF4151043.1 unnamed protein product [Rotaria socialis]
MINDTSDTSVDIDKELYPALIQCFFIIAVGYVAGQLNLLTRTQSTGLSRYISNFALPAVVFKNLVDLQFERVSWQFITSVLVAKTIVFLLTALLTGIGERPRNFASMGLHAIMASQSNDFALILPIIDAVYSQSHPDYGRYIYLLAPISLVILNPIGLLLIEIQKRLDDQKKHPNISIWHRCQLIRKIFSNISRNPIVICTLLGVVFNRIFNEHLPNIIEHILTPVAQSFSATALFYLGLTMAGKLRRLHTHLVVTVFALSMIKLILFPLILRQAVFLFVKSTKGTLNNTIDFSNFGFLYGTAPTAPSVIFYVPESNAALQTIASTGLIFSTLLSIPIMLVSAKMINLRTLDIKLKQTYESMLIKTSYDVSMISLLCTIIVLVGFSLRYRLLRRSPIHKYTFIFVGLQMIYAIWTISIQYVQLPISGTASIIVDTGSILLALTTRSWATSISIALMISFCYSNERAHYFFWLYHLFGWLVPICTTLIIYYQSSIDRSRSESSMDTEKFGTVQTSASVCLLAICIIITSSNLLRIARRTYRLKQNASETQPLINEGSEYTDSQTTLRSLSIDLKPSEYSTQWLRHSVLVGLLNINAFVCISVLLWSLLTRNRDGVYYELQFLDTVLLHGQGIITFLVFALDADLLLPISRKIIKLLNRFGLKIEFSRNHTHCRHSENERPLDFTEKIRSNFIRYSIRTQSASGSMENIETTFNENEFCQWLVTNGHMENESIAHDYCQELVNKRQIICIDRTENENSQEFDNHWYAFSK